MTDHVAGDWWLVIALGQPISDGSAEYDPAMGIIRIPFATQQSVHVAAGKLKLFITPPAAMVQGEVIRDHAAIEGSQSPAPCQRIDPHEPHTWASGWCGGIFEADPGRVQAIANQADYEVP